jgi:hypothetical protein
MKQRRPPKRLPREYLEIWSALEEADRVLASRRELARRLQVSTFTLQRILVDGDVPRLSRTASTRVLHSWTRILTRLACFFGKEPRRWVELAGVPWSEATSEVSRLAERDLDEARRPSTGGPPQVLPTAPLVPFPVPASAGRVEIGLVAGSPLATPLGDGSPSFLQEYAGRLLLAVDPSLRPVFRIMPEDELLRALTHPGTPLAFGIGVAATVARRRRGVVFLSLPGWRLRFGGLRLVPGRDPATDPDWSVVTNPAGDARLVVRAQTPAHQFLAGACGIPATRMVLVESGETTDPAEGSTPQPAEALAAAMLRETEASDQRPIFLVDDLAICREVRLQIETSGKSAWRCLELPPSASGARSYPLAVAVSAAAGALPQLLRAARDRELFGVAREETARLYAAFLVAAHRRRPFDPAVHLGSFRQAGNDFRLALCRTLLSALPGPALDDSSSTAALTRSPKSASGDLPLSSRTIDTAGRLLPATWGEALRAAVGELTPHPAAWHCRSCSASVHEMHNQGVSDHYCRYCSDERGQLRPREEVRQILARWLGHWQGEIPPDEAARRADSFMKAMPAWSEN